MRNSLILMEKNHIYKCDELTIELRCILDKKVYISIYDWRNTEAPLIKGKVLDGTLDTIDERKEIENILKEIESKKGEDNATIF